ncbi:MAG: hypothetical protein M3Y59_19910 [Myxococcota bacterium]|nr:hypothetical protein [Myxococcota bacterium]
MKLQVALCLASLAIPALAFGGDDHPKQVQPATGGSGEESAQSMDEQKGTGGSGQMDMAKMGPWTRKPTNEGKTKKEIQAFFKEEEKLMKSGDLEAALNRVDFPIYMATDNSKGEPYGQPWNREEYSEMMKPFFEQTPKDLKMTHKPTITVLSDSLALVVDDFSVTTGGKTRTGKNASLLVNKDGQWKWKMTAEAGWGESALQGVGGSGDSGEEPKTDEPHPMDHTHKD